MIVYYHKNCADGFAAALACWLVNPDWEYVAIQYGDKIPAGERMFLDFCPKYSDMMQGDIILDHHQSAKADFDRGVVEGLVTGFYDNGRSGAGMAYDYFQPDVARKFFSMVEDRDLWLFKIEGSRELNAYLRTLPFEFEAWKSVISNIDKCVDIGISLLKAVDQAVATICKNAYIDKFTGLPCVNSPIYQSEIGNYMVDMGNPIVAVVYQGDGFIQYSLRSAVGVDCSHIAVANGGGGHKNACGFRRLV